MRQVKIPNHLPFIHAVSNDAEFGGLLICRVLSITDVIVSTIRLMQRCLCYGIDGSCTVTSDSPCQLPVLWGKTRLEQELTLGF